MQNLTSIIPKSSGVGAPLLPGPGFPEQVAGQWPSVFSPRLLLIFPGGGTCLSASSEQKPFWAFSASARLPTSLQKRVPALLSTPWKLPVGALPGRRPSGINAARDPAGKLMWFGGEVQEAMNHRGGTQQVASSNKQMALKINSYP